MSTSPEITFFLRAPPPRAKRQELRREHPLLLPQPTFAAVNRTQPRPELLTPGNSREPPPLLSQAPLPGRPRVPTRVATRPPLRAPAPPMPHRQIRTPSAPAPDTTVRRAIEAVLRAFHSRATAAILGPPPLPPLEPDPRALSPMRESLPNRAAEPSVPPHTAVARRRPFAIAPSTYREARRPPAARIAAAMRIPAIAAVPSRYIFRGLFSNLFPPVRSPLAPSRRRCTR